MRKLIGAALAAAAFVLAGVPAFAADDPIEYFTGENVAEAVKAIGGTDVETGPYEGGTAVKFKRSGIPYLFMITVCKDRPGCIGLVMATGINTEGKKYALDLLNAFNRKSPPVTSIAVEDGNLLLWRALLSDGGIPKANLRANMMMLIEALPVFIEHLKQQLVATNEGGTTRFVPLSAATTSPGLRPIEPPPSQLQELIKDWAASAKR